MIFVIWGTTQWAASQLGHQAALGEPWLRAPVPIYPPWSFIVWDWRFGAQAAASAVFEQGHWMIAVPAHLLFVVAMAVAWRRARRLGGRTDSHGSARWAEPDDAEEAGLVTGRGVFLGQLPGSWRRAPRYLRHDGPQHVLGFAPTRSGKGVGWVLPTLLTWPESVLVHDIKGENWALSAGWRRERLGSVCIKFDPVNGDGSSARYNPLLEVRRGPEEVRDVQNIADMLVDPDGDGVKDHWDLTAEEVLVGTILHVLYVGHEKTLRACLELLTHPAKNINEVLTEMIETKHARDGDAGWLDREKGSRSRTHPVVAGAARALMNKSDNERSSVISSAVKCLSLYRDEIVAENTSASDLAITDLMHHQRPVSLYLTVPPSDIGRTRPLMRLLINQIGRRLTERMEFEGGRNVAHYRHRLLLMMDEFPSLGRLDFFQSQLAYLSGYGIKAFLIAQDLSQLYAAYGREESIVSNCHVRVAYAPNKIETARLLSDMAGTMTVHRNRRMYSGNRLAPWLSHVMASEEESQRPLLTPDEALRLPESASLVFAAGSRPLLAQRCRYYEDRILQARACVGAPATSDRLPCGESQWSDGVESFQEPSTEPDDLLPDSTVKSGSARDTDSTKPSPSVP